MTNRDPKVKSDSHSDTELKQIYGLKNIVVVGMSKNAEKPANFVPKYLLEHGYNILPVNPTTHEIMGRRSYSSIAEIPDPVDIVDIFRKSEDVPAVILDAIKKPGIKVVWMQEGIYNEEAEAKAKAMGMDVVFNRCMMAEHERLFTTD
jgi:predicted CoA-binding protein